MENYECRIATLDEMNKKWDYEIEHADDDKENWIVWKGNTIDRFNNGYIIPYYGFIGDDCICECTAAISPMVLDKPEGLIDDTTVYLMSFRTVEEYIGKGYFSKLYKFMEDDLRKRGYKRLTLGVEPDEETNKAIYSKYGFTEFIKKDTDIYPNGEVINVEYYGKTL